MVHNYWYLAVASIKIAFASQARSINLYKNLNTKVMNCFANIYFNPQSLTNKIIPNYAKKKIPCVSPANKITQMKAQTIRLKTKSDFCT